MNRRSFVTRAVGGLIGVALVDVEWIARPISAPLVADLSSIEGLTAAMLKEMCAKFSGRAEYSTASIIGEGGLTDQYNIQLAGTDADGKQRLLAIDRDIKPAASALMARARDFSRFGCLPTNINWDIEAAVAKDDASGLCVRGVRQYSIGDGLRPEGWMYRFDVVGGRA